MDRNSFRFVSSLWVCLGLAAWVVNSGWETTLAGSAARCWYVRTLLTRPSRARQLTVGLLGLSYWGRAQWLGNFSNWLCLSLIHYQCLGNSEQKQLQNSESCGTTNRGSCRTTSPSSCETVSRSFCGTASQASDEQRAEAPV